MTARGRRLGTVRERVQRVSAAPVRSDWPSGRNRAEAQRLSIRRASRTFKTKSTSDAAVFHLHQARDDFRSTSPSFSEYGLMRRRAGR